MRPNSSAAQSRFQTDTTVPPANTDGRFDNAPRGEDLVRLPETAVRSRHPATATFIFGNTADAADSGEQIPVAHRYKLIKLLGRGGQGEIWLAVDLNCSRLVVVKLLRADARTVPACAALAVRECGFLARFSHPNVVTLLDAGDCNFHGPYAVLEHLDGPNLLDRLRELAARGEQMPVREAVAIALAVASALRHVHARGVLHLDIKCGNIVLARGAKAKLIDFGVSAFRGEAARGKYAGTPTFSSPEQLRCRPDLDPRSDLYSLGVVMFVMLTGRFPFGGAPEADSARVVLPVSRLRPDVPPPLCRLVRRLLAAERKKRTATAATVAGRLRGILASLTRDSSCNAPRRKRSAL